MNLPSLKNYKDKFIKDGITFPLRNTLFNNIGLLTELPSVQSNKIGWPWSEQTDSKIYKDRSIWPKLTIVTPSYNQGRFLEETIRSVLLQNYPNLEYIIIDGGSTDNTREVLEKYAPWISYWQSEKDEGQGHAINLGFSLASGDYYAWINSDDYYLKNTFSTVISTFLKTGTEFIYGYGYNYHKKQQRLELLKVQLLFDYFIRIPTLIQPSCFWNKNIHQPIWEELQCSLDYELWLRMVRGKKRILIKQPLAVANVHDGAKTSDQKMKSAWEKDHQLICALNAHGPVNNWDKIVLIRRFILALNKLFEIRLK